MMGKNLKRMVAVLLVLVTFFAQSNVPVFAAETEKNASQPTSTTQTIETENSKTKLPQIEDANINVASKFVRVENQARAESGNCVSILKNDGYATVLIKAVAAFKDAILVGVQKGESETSVTFQCETKESYELMFDYLTSYLWYLTEWEPEMGLLEMALYNEAELRPYINFASAENHFVSASSNKNEMEFTIYWPILYNQSVKNHVSVTRSDGKVEKQEFVMLEDALDAMDEWNVLYGSDVDYTVEFLDICSSLIAPDRTEFPKANNIYFIGKEEWENVSDTMGMGVQYSLFVASDLKANSNISISVMNVTTGAIYYVEDLFTWDLNGYTLSNYGFTDFYPNIVNGDLFLSKDNSELTNPEQDRLFRVFGRVDIGTVRQENGYLELKGCFDSKIVVLEAVNAYVYGANGSSIEIGTKKYSDIRVETQIDLTIGDIIEDGRIAVLTIGMPEKGHYPKITGRVMDGNGKDIPLRLEFDDNFYTCGYDDTYYYGLNFDPDWIFVETPNVEKVYFTLEHLIYDESWCGRSLAVEGILSENEKGQYYLKSSMNWTGLEQTCYMELGKEYEANIQVYQDGKEVDSSILTTEFYTYSDANGKIDITQDGNTFTYSANTYGYYTALEFRMYIDQEEGITSWAMPIYVYAQKEVESITIPKEKLTLVDGLGDVYLMVMNGKLYNGGYEGINANVVSDEEYFVRYESTNTDLLDVDSIDGTLFVYGNGICDVIAHSGNKTVTYTVLIGKRTESAILYLNGEDVEGLSYYEMKQDEQVKGRAEIQKDTLEYEYGYEVEWSTSDSSIIKVDENGEVTAVGAGEAILSLTITCLDGTLITKELAIIVEEPEVVLNGWNQAEDGNWYYYLDGEVDTSLNGLVYNEDKDEWWYTVEGRADFTYTGLTYHEELLVYVENGVRNLEYTGLALYDNTWYYVENGQVNLDYTGLVEYSGVWYYVEDGVLNSDYTGLCEYYGAWYYVEAGVLNWNYTGLTCYYNTWYYVEGGILNWNYTGLTCYYDVWYYVEGGVLNWNYTGLTCYYDVWYYVEGGVLNWNYTGLTCYYDVWYYVQSGVLNWGYTGLCEYYGGWYYVEGGVLNWGYTGLCEYYGSWFYVEGGVLNWAYTGLCEYYGGWYYVAGGVLNWGYTGLCEYYGNWFYIANGVLDWSFTGDVWYNGILWHVVNGVLVGVA